MKRLGWTVDVYFSVRPALALRTICSIELCVMF